MSELIKNLLINFNIGSVTFVKLKNGGIIYNDLNNLHIILNSRLSPEAQLFAIFHEIGHAALHKMQNNPKEVWNQDVESMVHQWAIEQLRNFVPLCELVKVQEGFLISDNQGYILAENLFIKYGLRLNLKDLTDV